MACNSAYQWNRRSSQRKHLHLKVLVFLNCSLSLSLVDLLCDPSFVLRCHILLCKLPKCPHGDFCFPLYPRTRAPKHSCRVILGSSLATQVWKTLGISGKSPQSSHGSYQFLKSIMIILGVLGGLMQCNTVFSSRMFNSANSRKHCILSQIEIPDYAQKKHYHYHVHSLSPWPIFINGWIHNQSSSPVVELHMAFFFNKL